MICAKCNQNEVSFVCKFCGRLICKECVELKPYICAAFDEDGDNPKAIIVEDAAWCGECHPIKKAISLEEIE